jgi:2-oxoglutarate dehydrogenase E2 component (dihydrolipoamide succinyltransferase)
MPKLGESVMEATITSWLIEEGGSIEADDALVEIATDKVDSEVPAPEGGKLIKRLFNEGDTVKIGEVFAILETESQGSGDTHTIQSAEPVVKEADIPASSAQANTPAANAEAPDGNREIPNRSDSGRFYSPLVRTIAQTEGISLNELESIQGSGLEGRLTKEDVMGYLAHKGFQPLNQQAPAPMAAAQASTPASVVKPAGTIPEAKLPAVSVSGEDEIVEMDRMRKMIAANMVLSKQTSAHVTSFVEADVTNLVRWREAHKSTFQQKYGEKLTFTPMILEAVVQAIREFPGINASVDGDRIIYKKRINVGMAAALPSGNLIVPVIKHADQMNLLGLTKAVNDLSARARINKLKPDEIADGTYTVSNVGTFGNVMGTPIISQPQVAVLAVGAIRKKPAVIETPEGDLIGIRHMMFLSHSYDHRVVDGALGGSFVKRVADLLEAFDPNRII